MFNQSLNSYFYFARPMTEYLYLIAMVSCYIAFWLGSLKVFNHQKKVQIFHRYFFKVLVTFTWNYSVFIFYRSEAIQFPLLATAMAIMSLGLFLKTVSVVRAQSFSVIFDQEKPTGLFTEGPYKWIRHPFYTSYILVYLSFLLTSRDTLLWCLGLFIIGYYYFASRMEENSFLQSALADSYRTYQKTTGRFFPSLKAILGKTKNKSRT